MTLRLRSCQPVPHPHDIMTLRFLCHLFQAWSGACSYTYRHRRMHRPTSWDSCPSSPTHRLTCSKHRLVSRGMASSARSMAWGSATSRRDAMCSSWCHGVEAIRYKG